MADSQAFCVAEERSGHCAVVDGHFLYVWGGYVVRGRGGRWGGGRGMTAGDASLPQAPGRAAHVAPAPKATKMGFQGA